VLDKFKAMGALAGLMKNQEKLREAGQRVKERMASTRCTGQAGSGAARAVVTGKMEVIEIELSPALAAGMAADEKTRLLAGSLIAEAINDALKQAQLKLGEALKAESDALGLGDLGDVSALSEFIR